MSASCLRTNTTANPLRCVCVALYTHAPPTEKKKKGCRVPRAACRARPTDVGDVVRSWHACRARRGAKLLALLLMVMHRHNPQIKQLIIASMEYGRRPPLTSHLYLQKEEVVIVMRRLDHRITLFCRHHYPFPFHVHTRMIHAPTRGKRKISGRAMLASQLCL